MPDSTYQRVVATDDSEPLLVRSRLEIVAILRALIERKALVTVYFGDQAEFIVTALLAVDSGSEEIVFDCGVEKILNRRLLQCSRLTVETQIDHIRIRFVANRPEATAFRQAQAIRARMPDVVIRQQRRDSYRVKIPLGQPVYCVVQLDALATDASMPVRIGDVSCGGLALVDCPPTLRLAPGMVHAGCRIDLREIAFVTTGLEIVHVLERVNRNGLRMKICGCRFMNPSSALLTFIQRYINAIETRRKALS